MIESASSPTLLTSRLRLRPAIAEDAPALHGCYGDPEVMRYWGEAPSGDMKQTTARLAASLDIDPAWHATWAILLRDSGQVIGMMNYNHRAPAAKRLEIGYALARPHWRRGYMTEAIHAFLQHCFAGLKTHRVEALVDHRNTESIRFTEALGFRQEGLLRDRICVAGEYRSLLMFALLEEEWMARGMDHRQVMQAGAASRIRHTGTRT